MKNLIKHILFTLLLLNISFAETITVPVMLGQTGASATFGSEEFNGYTLAAADWNKTHPDKQIKLKFEDTQTNQKSIVTAFQKIALSNPKVILGPTWLDGFPAIIPMAEKKNIALVTPSSEAEAFGKYTGQPITFYYNTQTELTALSDEITKRGWKDEVALIYQHDPFAELARKLFLKADINLVADISMQGGETDFKSIITKMAHKKPKVLFILVWDHHSLLALLQQIKVLAPEIKLATIHDGEGWIKNKQFKPHISQIIYTKFIIDNKKFVERYTKEFGHKPFYTATNAYDAATSVFKAIHSGSDIRKYLLESELETVTFGKVRLNKKGGISASKVTVEEF